MQPPVHRRPPKHWLNHFIPLHHHHLLTIKHEYLLKHEAAHKILAEAHKSTYLTSLAEWSLVHATGQAGVLIQLTNQGCTASDGPGWAACCQPNVPMDKELVAHLVWSQHVTVLREFLCLKLGRNGLQHDKQINKKLNSWTTGQIWGKNKWSTTWIKTTNKCEIRHRHSSSHNQTWPITK